MFFRQEHLRSQKCALSRISRDQGPAANTLWTGEYVDRQAQVLPAPSAGDPGRTGDSAQHGQIGDHARAKLAPNDPQLSGYCPFGYKIKHNNDRTKSIAELSGASLAIRHCLRFWPMLRSRVQVRQPASAPIAYCPSRRNAPAYRSTRGGVFLSARVLHQWHRRKVRSFTEVAFQ